MRRLYGRRTSKLFQEFLQWARPIIGKSVRFYPAPSGAPLGLTREMGDHLRVQCDTSQPTPRLEAVVAHELMHVVLWREGFAKCGHRESAKGKEAVAARRKGVELGVCLSDPIIHHELTQRGFTVVQEVLSETVQNLIDRLKDEDAAKPEAHTWQGKVMALAHANVALSVGSESFAPVDRLLASRAPSIHALVRRALQIACQTAYDQPEDNWQALTRLFDLIDEPNVRLRRPDGLVHPPSASD